MPFIFVLFFSIFYITAEADVVYQKTVLKDPFGRKIVRLKIENDIVEGDYEKFKEAIIDINQNDYRVDEDSVMLNSRGGSMHDARKIGYLIRYNHLATKIERFAECGSACTFILVAGTCRMALGSVSLHRPWSNEPIDSKSFVMDLSGWSTGFDNEYLKQMNATQDYIDLINSTPSWTYYKLNKDEKKRMGLFYSTNRESKYRLEIASNALGKSKKDILENMKTKSQWFGVVPRQLTCSQQFYLDQLENKELISNEFLTDNFEVNETRQYYVETENPEMISGKPREFKTNKIPLKKGNVLVWELQHFSKGKDIEYKEVTTLQYPGQWTFIEEAIDDISASLSLSPDKKVATKLMKVPNTGLIMNGWGLDPAFDKTGPVKIQIYVDDKLMQTFNFDIVDITK